PGVDTFVVKRDATGRHLWSKQFGDTGDLTLQAASSLAIDSSGQILVGGSFDGKMDFGDAGTFTSNGMDLFVARLDPSGALVSKQRFGIDAFVDHVSALAFDPCDNPIMTGSFSGKLDLEPALTAVGGSDLFVARPPPPR